VREIIAVVYREYLVQTTSLTWIFFELALPLLYLLMFGVAFDRALGQGIALAHSTVSYNAFFLAGVLAMTCFGNAINQSYGFFIDRDNGIFYEFLTYPMRRSEYLLGKVLFQCGMTILQSVLTIGFSSLLLGVSISWQYSIVLLATMVVGTAGWFFFLSIFAFTIRRNDIYNMAINALYFVLMFLSSVFYPLDSVPDWLRAISRFNPLTWHADALRFLTIEVGDPGSILLGGAAFVVFSFASFTLAIRALQKSG
jgi:ABC-2 type transport system permease protein